MELIDANKLKDDIYDTYGYDFMCDVNNVLHRQPTQDPLGEALSKLEILNDDDYMRDYGAYCEHKMYEKCIYILKEVMKKYEND